MLDRIADTIVAISSAPGASPRGVVRLDGPEALSLVSAMACPLDGSSLHEAAGFHRLAASLRLGGHGAAPAVLYVFRAPRSYTRNNLIEIHTAGAPALLRLITERAVQLGARRAGPGEFTARAFLAGAMDLTGAEAVAGAIRAGDDRQLAAARRLRGGRLAQRVGELCEELAEVTALVEAGIDFVDEPIEFIATDEVRARLASLVRGLEDLVRRSVWMERLEETPRVLLVGRPNAGKSTLLNALAGVRRAISSPIAGTTRDILHARITCGALEVLLLDAAGIDDPDDWGTDVPDAAVRSQARALALEEIDHVDAVLFVSDTALGVDEVLRAEIRSRTLSPMILVLNKCDLAAHGHDSAGPPVVGFEDPDALAVSALRGDALDALRERIAETLANPFRSAAAGATVLTTARHREAVADAVAALRRSVEACGCAAGVSASAELVAFELREALEALGTITGAVTTEDLLGRIFSGFCIGK